MITYQEGTDLPFQQVLALYEEAGWTAYTAEPHTLQRAIAQSCYVLTAWDEAKLVGLLRCVGDGQTILYIQDLLVAKEYQRQKIGASLMRQLLTKFATIRQKVLLTEESPKVRAFYEACGFISCDQGNLVAFTEQAST